MKLFLLLLDDDDNGIVRLMDAGHTSNASASDTDGDGIIDEWDEDIDGDGYSNNWDDFPYDSTENQ